MAVTGEAKQSGLIRGVRDVLRRSQNRREPNVTENVRRSGRPMIVWDPLLATGEQRWSPLRSMRELLLRWPWMPSSIQRTDRDAWIPRVEVREGSDALRFIMDVPGVLRDDLLIRVVGPRLIVSGRRDCEVRAIDESIQAVERPFGEFQRSFALPGYAERDLIMCDLRDGVLTIVVPLKGGLQVRTVEVTNGSPAS